MTLPSEVWIVLIVLVALVAAIIIWKGGQFKVHGGMRGFTFEGRTRQRESDRGKVVVGRGTKITESEVGNITGVKGGQPPTEGVDVLSKAKVRRSKVGDIVGAEQRPTRDQDKEQGQHPKQDDK